MKIKEALGETVFNSIMSLSFYFFYYLYSSLPQSYDSVLGRKDAMMDNWYTMFACVA